VVEHDPFRIEQEDLGVFVAPQASATLFPGSFRIRKSSPFFFA